jgi:HEAT repeat protein
MSTSPKLPHFVPRIALCFVLACPLLPGLAQGQAAQNKPSELDTAIANVKSGNVSPRDAVVIADAGAVQAIPALEEQFKRAHHVSVSTAFQYARYDIPGKVLQLATAGDPRGIPLLRRALRSRNYLIVTWAAKGLAQIQDKQSIPLIIAAAQRAPTGYPSLIAESLLYFDDAQAQSAVDTYMPKDRAAIYREARARGMGVFGW